MGKRKKEGDGDGKGGVRHRVSRGKDGGVWGREGEERRIWPALVLAVFVDSWGSGGFHRAAPVSAAPS